MATNKQQIIQWIDTIRSRTNASIKEIALKSELSVSVIYQWIDEKNINMPNYTSIKKIENYFNIYLNENEENDENEPVIYQETSRIEYNDKVKNTDENIIIKLNTTKFTLNGYLANDIIVFNTVKTPEIGDLILVGVNGKERLGFFQPPYVVRGAVEITPENTPVFLDNRLVRVLGVFEKLIRNNRK